MILELYLKTMSFVASDAVLLNLMTPKELHICNKKPLKNYIHKFLHKSLEQSKYFLSDYSIMAFQLKHRSSVFQNKAMENIENPSVNSDQVVELCTGLLYLTL